MKRLLIGALAALSLAASEVPGPPEELKSWPRSGADVLRCADGINVRLAEYTNSDGRMAYEYIDPADNTFAWTFDTQSGTPWAAWREGDQWFLGTLLELIEKHGPSPCGMERKLTN